MKKYFYAMMALLVVVVASCKKPEPEPIVVPDDDKAYDVLYEVDVKYYFDLGYGGTSLNYDDFVKDGKHIWEQFGLNSEADFIKALGDVDVSDGGAQSNETIKFGAIDGSTGYVNETVSTTNGWGHWFSAQGDVAKWADGPSFFTEGYFVGNGSLVFTLGNYPGKIAAGEKYTIIELFYDDEMAVAVQFNITVTDEVPEVKLNKVGEAKTKMKIGFDSDYTTYEVTGIDYAAIAQAIGCEVGAATFYGVDAAGKPNALFKGTDIWYNADGPASWGAGCTIHFGYDADNGVFTTCLYPDEELIGKTHSLTVAVANGNNAFFQTVEVEVAGQDTWTAAATIKVQGDAVDTNFDFAPLVAYFGFDNLKAFVEAVLSGELKMSPLNADGSVGPYSQNYTPNDNGVFVLGSFYNVNGNVVNWNSGEDAYYFDFYGDNEGDGHANIDVTPFTELTEDYVKKTLTFLLQFTYGDKTAYVRVNVAVESAVPWASYEAAEGNVFNIKMMRDQSYTALRLDFSNEDLASALGVENLGLAVTDGSVKVAGLNADGSVAYGEDGTTLANTGEDPFGHWFNKSGDVCGWNTENCAMCFNVKVEDGVVCVYTCQFHENVEVGDSFVCKQRYMAGDKSVDVTYNVTIVESI